MVQIQALHPISEKPLALPTKELAAFLCPQKEVTHAASAYPSYALKSENASQFSHDPNVASLRSSPVALVPIRTKIGTQAYRVTGTIGGKQRKRQFQLLEDAEIQRDTWELERISAAAAMRPKITRLTQNELVEAEACLEMLKGSGFSLIDATKAFLRNPPAAPCELTFVDAAAQFLAARKAYISAAQFGNYETVVRRFGASVKPNRLLRKIETRDVEVWLESLDVGAKSWNNYRADLSGVFNWFANPPRKWVSENPVASVARHRKRDTLPGLPEILPVERCAALMEYLETEKPHWCCYFALCLFAGIRPDGEISKLAALIEREPVSRYIQTGGDGCAEELVLPANVYASGI